MIINSPIFSSFFTLTQTLITEHIAHVVKTTILVPSVGLSIKFVNHMIKRATTPVSMTAKNVTICEDTAIYASNSLQSFVHPALTIHFAQGPMIKYPNVLGHIQKFQVLFLHPQRQL